MFPNYDPDVINQIYEVQNFNFDKTVDDIQANSGKPAMTMADALKKRKHLLEEVKVNCDRQFPKLNDAVRNDFQYKNYPNSLKNYFRKILYFNNIISECALSNLKSLRRM